MVGAALVVGCGSNGSPAKPERADHEPVAPPRASGVASDAASDPAHATAEVIRSARGATRASMGPLLAGIELGAPITDEIRARVREIERTSGIHVGMLDRENAMYSVLVVPPQGTCAAFELEAAWGKPDVDDGENRQYWLDPATGMRAQLDQFRGRCTLSFEQYLTAERLVDAVPFTAVGHSRDLFVKQLGHKGKLDDVFHFVGWELPPLGATVADSTRASASYRGSKIISVSVTGSTDATTMQSVLDVLTKRFGAPVTTRDPNGSYWHRWAKPQIQLLVIAGSTLVPTATLVSFDLVAGNPH